MPGEVKLGLDPDPDPPDVPEQTDHEQRQAPLHGIGDGRAPPPLAPRPVQQRRGDHERDQPRDLDPVQERRPRLLAKHRAHRTARECRAVGARVVGAGDAAEARRAEPEREVGDEQKHDETAGTRVAPHQPQPVRHPEDPQLRAVERRDEAERERAVAVTVEKAVDPHQHHRGREALGIAERVVRDEARRVDDAARGDQGRQQARRPREQPGALGLLAEEPLRQPPREPEHHHDGGDGAGARDDQPQVGLRVPEQREQRREDHRQRLPARAAGDLEVGVDDLPAPDQPRPRVVAGRGGDQQRRHPEYERRHPEYEVEAHRPVERGRAQASANRAAGGHRGVRQLCSGD